jgi:phage terminase large subunit
LSDLTSLGGEKLLEWRRNPAQMVRELFGVEPDPWQLDGLMSFPNCPRLAMQACTGPGKTALLAWLGWNFLLTRPHPYIACTSITGDNLNSNLWTELSRWREKSDWLKTLFEKTATKIYSREFPETWKLEARKWAKDANAEAIGNALAGVHADYVMWLLDESGDYPDAIMPTCEAIFSGNPKEAHIVQAGNPTRRGGPLFKAAFDRTGLWKVIRITADPDDPNRTPRVSVEHARSQIQQWGRDNPWVKVKIFGEFPDSDFNALIGADEVLDAFRRYHPEPIGARIIGVDVALYGDDASCVMRRHGLQAFKPRKFRNISPSQGGGMVAREWEEWQADAVFIDSTGGFGSGWIDKLINLGKAPIGVNFAQQAHLPERFHNKRAEMYFDCVEWIRRGGALPEEPEILQAITQTTYVIRNNKLLLEPKDDVKLKLGYSPDMLDALCFVPGTRIAVTAGWLPIEKIRAGERVLTPFGEGYVAAIWAQVTTRLATVVFSDGSSLVATPEHEIFVYGHGKVRIDALSLTMAVSPFRERGKWLRLSGLFTKARSIGFKKAAGILPPEAQFSASAFCIGVYGPRSMALFRRAMRSITEIATGAIVTLAIWNCSLQRRTRQNMPKKAGKEALSAGSLITPERPPLLGINQTKEEIGIASTAKLPGKDASRRDLLAKSAGRNSTATLRVAQDIAQAPAISASVLGRISQIREIVRSAARSFRQIVIGKPPVVPVFVRIASVPPTTVYNLTLDRDNAYYANGILVFNCLTFAETVSPAKTRLGRPQHQVNYDPYAEPRHIDRQGPRGYDSGQDYDPFR